jgi:hypothetical protein
MVQTNQSTFRGEVTPPNPLTKNALFTACRIELGEGDVDVCSAERDDEKEFLHSECEGGPNRVAAATAS